MTTQPVMTATGGPSLAAAAAEIVGCFAFRVWLRLNRPAFQLLPGGASLPVFAWALTLNPAITAGRAFAAYGGIYIVASLLWSWTAESADPGRLDLANAGAALVAATLLLFAPHAPAPHAPRPD